MRRDLFRSQLIHVFTLLASLAMYNLNKFYFRYQSMEREWFRIATDVLPNFIIIIIFYSGLAILRQLVFNRFNKRLAYYFPLAGFCLLLGVEEYTGMLMMSKVSDLNDSFASSAAGILVVVSTELSIRRS